MAFGIKYCFSNMGVVMSFFSDESLPGDDESTREKSFILLDYNNAYETRMFESECWISTSTRCELEKEFKRKVEISTRKLNNYLRGKNASEIHLGNGSGRIITRMTYPASSNDDITVSMKVPEDYRGNPPEPSASDVFLEEQQKRLIYAAKIEKSVGGDEWKMAYARTKKSLDLNNEDYSNDVYYRVNYKEKRRGETLNELWMIGETVTKGYTCLKNDEDSEQ